MIGLNSTAKFSVFDWTSPEGGPAQPHLPPLPQYTTSALREYHQYVPDDMDWDIYEACAISIKEQRELSGDPGNKDGVAVLTYGEINFDCFAEVLYDLKVKHHLLEGKREGGVFYDLGSGTGKVVLAAAILHGFSACCGIELLTGLHEIAVGYKESWDKTTNAAVITSCANSPTAPVARPTLEYVCGSILDTGVKNWPKDADVVFSNTHCFDVEMMKALSVMAADMKPGSYFICTTVTLDERLSGGFKVVAQFQADMSWGVADGFVLRKPL